MEGKEIRLRHVSVSLDDDEVPQSAKAGKARSRAQDRVGAAFPWSRSTRLLLLSLLPFVVVLVLFARLFGAFSSHSPFLLPATFRRPEPSFDNRIQQNGRLHPDDHVYRAATTQTLDWRVTTGQRRPDGVQKRVYLINGSFQNWSDEETG